MKLVQSITAKLGAIKAKRVIWSLAAIFCLWAVTDLFVLRLSSGVATSTYDAMVKNRFIAAKNDPRIVIVDIDEASLLHMSKEFGRWPWPRDTLATVLDHIEGQAPVAVVWDILFADADRLSPGGDKAFDEAAKRSRHSLFPVVRLPRENDKESAIGQAQLPSLWLSPSSAAQGAQGTTVALIAPVLPSLTQVPLGYNNGYTDDDGVLRRYRYLETLQDGSSIQSMALAVAKKLSPENAQAVIKASTLDVKTNLVKDKSKDPLMAWRKNANAYPRVPFADVFTAAEGGKPKSLVPDFKNKVVLIGATATSLHDIHPTPLSAHQAGVDSLATAIDNAINAHLLTELPNWLQAGLAVLLTLGLALWVHRFGVSSLHAALLPLPALLLGIGYLSLNLLPTFIDLHLAAGAALLFIAALRTWNNWRIAHWSSTLASPVLGTEYAMARLHLVTPAANQGLDTLIAALERVAPDCRILGGDASAAWPLKLNWPELLQDLAVYGPKNQIAQLQTLPSRVASVVCQQALANDRLTDRAYLVNCTQALFACAQQKVNASF